MVGIRDLIFIKLFKICWILKDTSLSDVRKMQNIQEKWGAQKRALANTSQSRFWVTNKQMKKCSAGSHGSDCLHLCPLFIKAKTVPSVWVDGPGEKTLAAKPDSLNSSPQPIGQKERATLQVLWSPNVHHGTTCPPRIRKWFLKIVILSCMMRPRPAWAIVDTVSQ